MYIICWKRRREMKEVKMMRNIVLITILVSSPLFGQIGWTWVRAIGGGDSDKGNGIAETSTGFAVAGLTRSGGAGQDDAMLMALDGAGLPLWTRAIGGNSRDDARDMITASDGNLVLAGMTRSYGSGRDDAFVTKMTPGGILVWSVAVGDGQENGANAITETSDGSLVMVGNTNDAVARTNNIIVARLNSTGDLIWMRTIQGSGNDEAYGVIEASDGSYIVTGLTASWGAGANDAFIMKLSPTGNLLWLKTFGGAQDERGYAIANTADGGFIVGGSVESWGNGSRDVMIAKFDVAGNFQWANAIGGSNYDEGKGIDQLADGGFALTGNRQEPGNAWSAISVRLDASAAFMWGNQVGGPNFENPNRVTATADGGYVYTGYSNSWGSGTNEVLVAKFLSDGTNCWGQPWNPGVVAFTPMVSTVSPTTTPGGSYTIVWPTITILTFQQYEICALYSGTDESEENTGLSMTWRPSKLCFQLPGAGTGSLSLYDGTGRLVAKPVDGQSLGEGEHSVEIDGLGPGIYFGVLEFNSDRVTASFVVGR